MQTIGVKDVAGQMGMSEASVRRLYKSGDLPAMRLGPRLVRFSQDAIDAWAESQTLNKATE